ncbi:hypothetical protein Hanom_Chr10g00880581 [Helianthus anomalus]
MLGMNVGHKIRIILIICFVCLTCVAEHSFYLVVGSSTLTVALSRNLYYKKIAHSY